MNKPDDARSDSVPSRTELANAPVSPDRRGFMARLAALGVGGQTLLQTGSVSAAVAEGKAHASLSKPGAWPEMAYRPLGRTGHLSSRLIFGCGAALSRKPRNELLSAAFDAGVNTFDVGFRGYYDDAEKNLAPFLKAHGDKLFLISKAIVPTDVSPTETIKPAAAKRAAEGWLKRLDGSLRELDIEHVDAYYLMASNNVSVITSDEIQGAFARAKAAGKVSHLGISTHQNASNVLAAAAKLGTFSLAMIAITPGGWYDWETREVLPGSPPMTSLQDELQAARDAGVGLIGMKAGRFLAGRSFLGWGNPDAFDQYYDKPLLSARLSEFQRSYAYVLEHGLDAVNADMQSLAHLKENFIAAATSNHYFDSVSSSGSKRQLPG